MRLIDEDVLLKNLEWLEDYDHYVLHDVKMSIDETPTVKAIPIEWIKKKSLEFLMNRNFRWATDFQEVIDMWKVENNIPLFDDEYKPMLNREIENEKDI